MHARWDPEVRCARARRLRRGCWYALRAVVRGEAAHLLLAGDRPAFGLGQSPPITTPDDAGGPEAPATSLPPTSPGRMRAFRHMRRHPGDDTGALERAFTGTDSS